MGVGVGTHFHGFTIDRVLFCAITRHCVRNLSFSISAALGSGISKIVQQFIRTHHPLTRLLASPNKKIIIIIIIMNKNMEISMFFGSHGKS